MNGAKIRIIDVFQNIICFGGIYNNIKKDYFVRRFQNIICFGGIQSSFLSLKYKLLVSKHYMFRWNRAFNGSL